MTISTKMGALPLSEVMDCYFRFTFGANYKIEFSKFWEIIKWRVRIRAGRLKKSQKLIIGGRRSFGSRQYL